MKPVFIASAKRTPIGTFQGALSTLSAPQLGAEVIKSSLKESGFESVDQCIMGQVLTAGAGQAPARQAAIFADLPKSTPCMTINKVCGSGLKAVMLANDAIQLEQSECVVAGGQENMSLSPHLLTHSRKGYKMGPVNVEDSMIKDGLWDPYYNFHMGTSAEFCVKEYKMTREEQDQFAIESYKLSQKAQAEKFFEKEITPITAQVSRKEVVVSEDEEPQKVKFDKIPQLRAVFEKEGTITAANASSINDGASALVLCSEKALGSGQPLVRILGHETFAQDPKWFTTAPVAAIKKLLETQKKKTEDIDLWEINEAFSCVTLAAMKDLNIPREKVNVHGGAVSLGHPIGASGARILTTLVHALHTHNKKYGLASICLGGGEAVAMLVEKV